MCFVHQGFGHDLGLHAVDGRLYPRVQVLDAQTEAIETQRLQVAQGKDICFTGVDLDGVIAVRSVGEPKPRVQPVYQVAHLRQGQERWGATAPVQLLHGPPSIQVARGQHHFTIEARQVGLGQLGVLGGDLVAGAVEADLAAKGHVHVQGERPLAGIAARQGFSDVVGTDACVKGECCGVGRIAWAAGIVTAQQGLVPGRGLGRCEVRSCGGSRGKGHEETLRGNRAK